MERFSLLDRAEVRELPSLKVYIYSGGEMVRVEEMPDPRAAFLKELAEQGREFGLTAVPA